MNEWAPEWTDEFELASSHGWWPFDPYVHDPAYIDDEMRAMAEEIAVAFIERNTPMMSPRPSALAYMPPTVVGWSQPPHPVDVIVSFNPHASKAEKAAAVLLDYYHDDALRHWADDGNVKRCFIGGNNPQKENHDPLLLIAAHANPHHKIWSCSGIRWKDLDDAVQGAIARRTKLGPLPKASYDTNPIVIYYYDNDFMKRITYPLASVPDALNPENATGARYWAMYSGPGDDAHVDAGLDKSHTLQTNDPTRIRIERENPGWKTKADLKKILAKYSSTFQHSDDCPTCTGQLSMPMKSGSAGGWDDEGFDWDRDVAGTGIVGSITGAILALVSAVLTATGVGAIVGVPLGIATPVIVAAINDLDVGLHTGDFGAGIAGLATAIAQAATSAAGSGGISLPPAAMKSLAGAVTAVSNSVRAGEKKKLDFGQIWNNTAKQVAGHKLGDDEAIAIAQMLSGQGPAAGHVFIQGYLAGKFLDAKGINAIAKLMNGMSVFADPRIINLGLLGMGFGQIAKKQGYSSFAPSKSSGSVSQAAPSRARGHATHGEFVGQDSSSKQYGPMSQTAISSLLARAQAAGLAVSGSNPWTIDTHEHGVKLSVSWDPASGTTIVSVTDKYPYVSNAQIWERIDALAGASMTHVTGAMLSPKDKLDAFVQFRLVPRYTKHATSGPYDIADDIHQDERIEVAQGLLNQLRGAKPGDVLFLSSTGILDAPTREAVRSFQFEAGVGSYDGMPTTETLLALEAEVQRKADILAGAYLTGPFVTGVGFDTHVPAGTLIYDGPNGHPISMIAEDTRAMFMQRLGHWMQLDIDGTHVWVQDAAIETSARGYGTGQIVFTGQTSLTPPPDYGPLSRGCPTGSWWDPFTSTCRTATPLPMPPTPQPMPGPPPPAPLPINPVAPTPTSTQGWFYSDFGF